MSGEKTGLQNQKHKNMLLNNQKIDPKVRLKLWEIDKIFRCPVVGMCISISEQKQLLKKTGFSTKKKSPYEIHETLVACAGTENILSRKVDNFLNRRFGWRVTPFLELGDEEFMSYFKSAFSSGEFLVALWAAAIRPEMPATFKRIIFGEIHMCMHQNGAYSMKLNQKLSEQEKKLNDLRQKSNVATRHNRSLRKENERLKENQVNLKLSLVTAKKEKKNLKEKMDRLNNFDRFSKFEQENRSLNEELKRVTGSLKKSQAQSDRLEEETRKLKSELAHLTELNLRFRKEIQEIIGEIFAANHCDKTCPSYDLCKKRILIVGGITRMESLYRQLVESSGGVFEYHDGYLKKGVRMLESRLRRADLVICPVSCNSHAACSTVKNLAKKHKKTVHMLQNSSLNAVSQAIRGNENALHTVK